MTRHLHVTPLARQWRLLFDLLLVALLFRAAPTAHAQNPIPSRPDDETTTTFVPGVIWVRFAEGSAPQTGRARTGFPGFDDLAAPFQVTRIQQAFPELELYARKRSLSASMHWLLGVYQVTFSAAVSPERVAATLRHSQMVEMAEPQPIYQVAGAFETTRITPNDARYSTHQQYMSRMKLEEAWDLVKGDSGNVIIAILDTGLDIDHEDHAPNLWTNPDETPDNGIDDDDNGYVDDMHGWNFMTNGADPTPSNASFNHGTLVAGAANAATNNSLGIAGAAWNAKTMAIHAGCYNDGSTICFPVKSLIYAYSNGADIANMSWGAYGHFATIYQAVQSASDAGTLLIAAGGNDGFFTDNLPFYPAAYPEVLSVGATKPDSDGITSFSNFGRTVNMYAPGESIITTDLNNQYVQVRGTSISAPFVAGIAALAVTLHEDRSSNWTREHVRLTADNIDASNSSNLSGHLGTGRVNAYRALTESGKPGVRLTSATATETNGDNDGVFESNEDVTVTATFINYGADAANVTIDLENTDTHLTWLTSSHRAGALKHGESYTGVYTLNVGSSAPREHLVRLRTRITEGNFSDGPDFTDVIFHDYPLYVTHTTPALKVSIMNNGNIGYFSSSYDLNSSRSPHSDGFRVLYDDSWRDYIHDGGLLVGIAADRIVSSVRPEPYWDPNVFDAKLGGELEMIDPEAGSSQHSRVTLVEFAQSRADLGLEIVLDSYTYSASEQDNFAILRYTLRNTEGTALNGMYAGLFVNWRLYPLPENYAKYDVQRNLGYAQGRFSPLVGVQLIIGPGNLSYVALDNRGVLLDDGFTYEEKWTVLTGGVGTTTLESGDAAHLIATGPIDLSANDSQEVIFALVSGTNESRLKQNADAAYRLWHPDGTVEIELAADYTTLSEASSATLITVTASTRNDATVNTSFLLPIAITGSGEEQAVDFAEVPSFSITLSPGASSATGTFTLIPDDDQVDELDETISISSNHLQVKQAATLTLTDDDPTPTGITITVSPTSISEGAGATTVTVVGTVNGGAAYATAQSVDLTVGGSTTPNAVGFTPVSGVVLDIAAGSPSGTTAFTVIPDNNTIVNADQTIYIFSSSLSNFATITLHDDDEPGAITITLSVSPASIYEGNGATEVTVTATSTSTFSHAQVLPITVTSSGEDSEVDFAAVPDFNLTLPASATTATVNFTLTPVDDQDPENDAIITISSSSAAVTNSATITLYDNDSRSITLAATPSSVSENDGPTTITVTATTSTTADAQVLDLTVTGSGIRSAVDFAAVTGVELTLPAGATTAATTFTLTPTDDLTDETDERISIGSTHPLVAQPATVLLTDNDDTPAGILLGVSPALVVEGDGPTPVTVTGTVSGGTTYGAAQSLELTIAGSGQTDVVRFIPVSDVVLPIAAETARGKATFSLIPLDDTDITATETITVSSGNPLVLNTAILSLYDDETGTAIRLTLSPASVNEDAGVTLITVTGTSSATFSTPQTLPITVAGSGEHSAVDFAAVTSFDLTLPANTTTTAETFRLIPADDQVDEMDETITVSSSSALVLQAATLRLTDDDDSPNVTLSASPTAVNEGDGETIITITGLVAGGTTFGAAQSLSLLISGSGNTNAVGFTPVTGVVLPIAAEAGSGSVTFTLTPTDNTDYNADETITVSSSSAQVVVSAATITLRDNDGTPVTLRVNPASVSEGDGATTITVTASSSVLFTDAQILPITVAGSGASQAVDFSPVAAFDLTLSANHSTATGTFTLSPTDDQVDEVEEIIQIISTSTLVQNSPTVTLHDDDHAPEGAVLSVAPTVVREDEGTMTITVTATVRGGTMYAYDKPLNISVAGSGMPGAVDFARVPEFLLTIPATMVYGTGSFVLTPDNDQDGESDETITISSDSTFVLSDATLILQDDDGGRTSRDGNTETVPFGVTAPYPNPASGTITFVLSSPAAADRASLRLYNMLGQTVAVPFQGALHVGEHIVKYDGQHLPAGMYVYVFESAGNRHTGQLIITQ